MAKFWREVVERLVWTVLLLCGARGQQPAHPWSSQCVWAGSLEPPLSRGLWAEGVVGEAGVLTYSLVQMGET